MRTLMIPVLFLTACGSGAGTIEGLDFDLRDAVYTTPNEGSRATLILASDAEDLCSLINSDRTLANTSKLAIRSWSSGTAHVDFKAYDNECKVTDESATDQGWVEMHNDDHWEISVDFAFRASHRNVSGQVNARYCDIPARGCAP